MLVFVHGLWHTADVWQPFLQFFRERNIECTAIQLREGRDSATIRFSDYVDTMEDTVTEDDIVVGHSMGGLIMQKVAEEVEIRGGVGICSAPPKGIGFKKGMVLSSLRYLPKVVLKKPFKPSYGFTRKTALNCVKEDMAEQLYERDFTMVPPMVSYELTMNKIAVNEATVDCPLHFMAATDDRLSPPPLITKIADKYNASYSLHRGCHYMFHQWEPYAQRIASFLDIVNGPG